MTFKEILDLKTKFDLTNDQPPEKLFIARSDEDSLMMDIYEDESIASLEVRIKIKKYGISEVQLFLEERLNMRVIVDYTDPKGTHFE